MTATTTTTVRGGVDARRMPIWYWAIGGLGLVWNGFGLKQFIDTTTATPEQLMATGLSPAQAELYAGLPAWMDAAFALGVMGGMLGCMLLLLRRRLAVPVLTTSLLGYAVLYIGDITQGVFALFGAPQVAVLTLVLLIAAALLGMARRFAGRGDLV